MFQRILVPLDGSKPSEGAIPIAARIARASGGTIVFVGVVLPPVEFGTYSVERTVLLKPSAFERREEAMTSYLASLTDTYASQLVGLTTEMDLSVGAAAPEIEEVARQEQVDLIVLCNHGETGWKRWFFGSVAQQMVRHSSVPVLVLNEQAMASKTGLLEGAGETAHPLRVLVPLDGSLLAESALLPAAELMAVLSTSVPGELHLLRVVDLPSAYGTMKSQAHISDSMQEEARHEAEQYLKTMIGHCHMAFAELEFTLHVTSSVIVSTDVAGTIVKEAEQAADAEHAGGYDLIALATHGRGGLRRLVMGSVAEHVLGATKHPLLMVRLPHTDHTDEEPGDAVQTEVTEVELQSWVGLL